MNWHLIRPPSYLEIAAQQLDEAQREYLTAAKSKEYYAAMERMLEARISRISAFIAAETQQAATQEPLS
jgi:hypothetical protein